MAEKMMKQNVENKSPQLNQTGKKSKLFLLKENKGFYVLLENFCFIYSFQSLPDQKDLDTKKKYKRNKKGESLVLVCQNLLRLIILSGSF